MLKRITLHNFMSHSHTVIDLSEGLTVLTGPNNCGKSAFVSALQILAENSNGDFMVRHGAKECRIIVETDDGHTIEWKRKKKTVSYCIDGEEFHRLRNSVPDKLHEVLKLSQVKAGDSDEFDVHFGTQKSPIFLLGDPGSRAARFFASSSDASKLIEMQKLHRNKVKSAQQQFQWQQAESKQNAATLETLKPIPDLESRLEELNQSYERLSGEGKQIQQLETLIQNWEKSAQSVERETQLVASLKQLPSTLEQTDEQGLATLIENWHSHEQELSQSQVTVSTLEALNEPPELDDERAFETLIQGITSQQQVYEYSGKKQESLAELLSPPSMTDSRQLEQLLIGWEQAEERVQRDQETAAVLEECVHPPEMVSGEQLAQLCQQWELAAAELQKVIQDHAGTEAEYERVRAELMHWVEENPTCPTCGAELEPDQFVQSAETGLKGHIHGS